MFPKATAAFAAVLALPFAATALSIPAQLQLADTYVELDIPLFVPHLTLCHI
jgi:hypothetical protein